MSTSTTRQTLRDTSAEELRAFEAYVLAGADPKTPTEEVERLHAAWQQERRRFEEANRRNRAS